MNNILFLVAFVPLAIFTASPSYAMKRKCEPDSDPWEIFVNEILARKTVLELNWEGLDDRPENYELSLSSDNDILRLAKAIKSKDGLTNFSLSCDCCSNKGALALADALRSLPKLTNLFLELWPKHYRESYNQDDIDAQGTEAIINAIKFLPLNDLKLHLPLDEDSCRGLSGLIKCNNTLKSLYIETLEYKKGAYFILKALADNKTITTLEFFFVDGPSLLTLGEVIRNNGTITTLTISGDNDGGLDDFSFRAFFGGIAINKALTTLSLPFIRGQYLDLTMYDNYQEQFDYNQLQIITDALKSNKALTTLDIPWLNEPSMFDQTEIDRLLFLNQIQPILDKNRAWPHVKFIAFAIHMPEGDFKVLPPEVLRILLQKYSVLCGALK